MRILLLNVPIRVNSPPNSFPVGLGIITQVLMDEGHDVEVLDANALRLSFDQVMDHCVKSQPEVIGISGLISTYSYQCRLAGELRARLSKCILVSGGGCATGAPDLLMEHSPIDISVISEGENTMKELLKTLENEGDLSTVDGIVFRRGEELIHTPPRKLESDLDNFPMPAYKKFPTEIYINNELWFFKNSITIVSSRGCPMDCNFCAGLFGRRSYRKRSAGAIQKEIQFLKKEYGVSFIGFVDDNLTINKTHLKEVCEVLLTENISWGCHGRVDTADDERLSVMERSGCKWLGFGIESGSQKILDAMNKKATIEQAVQAITKTRAHNIFANTTFIFGYPGEDEISIAQTMQFKTDLNLLANDFLATPYPGTKLYEMALEKGLIKDEHLYLSSLNDATDFIVNLTDFSDERLLELKRRTRKELEIALQFKTHQITEELAPTYLELADSVLNNNDLVWDKTKGYVLAGLTKYFTSIGDLDMASKTGMAARSFGVLA